MSAYQKTRQLYPPMGGVSIAAVRLSLFPDIQSLKAVDAVSYRLQVAVDQVDANAYHIQPRSRYRPRIRLAGTYCVQCLARQPNPLMPDGNLIPSCPACRKKYQPDTANAAFIHALGCADNIPYSYQSSIWLCCEAIRLHKDWIISEKSAKYHKLQNPEKSHIIPPSATTNPYKEPT